MLYTILKLLISAGIIVAVSEVAKRQSALAAFLASLPLTSLLAFIWMYVDTGQVEPISELSMQIFWLVIPSLLLFITLPILIRWGLGFWMSLILASALTAFAYIAMTFVLKTLGIKF